MPGQRVPNVQVYVLLFCEGSSDRATRCVHAPQLWVHAHRCTPHTPPPPGRCRWAGRRTTACLPLQAGPETPGPWGRTHARTQKCTRTRAHTPTGSHARARVMHAWSMSLQLLGQSSWTCTCMHACARVGRQAAAEGARHPQAGLPWPWPGTPTNNVMPARPHTNCSGRSGRCRPSLGWGNSQRAGRGAGR